MSSNAMQAAQVEAVLSGEQPTGVVHYLKTGDPSLNLMQIVLKFVLEFGLTATDVEIIFGYVLSRLKLTQRARNLGQEWSDVRLQPAPGMDKPIQASPNAELLKGSLEEILAGASRRLANMKPPP